MAEQIDRPRGSVTRSVPTRCLAFYSASRSPEVTVYTAEDLPPLRGSEQARRSYLVTPDAIGAAGVANPGDTEQAKREALDRLSSPNRRASWRPCATKPRGGDGTTPAN